MLKLIKNISLVLLAFGVFFIGALTVLAESRTGERVTVGEDEVINDDLFIAGADIEIEGVVNGDVYAAGQRIEVSGEINGDLIVGGETLIVTGIVRDDIRAAGETLTLEGATVDDGVMFFGGTLALEEDTEINGSVMFYGGELTSEAHITRSLRAGADTVEIGGEINGNVHAEVNRLEVQDGAVVDGNINYVSEREAVVGEGAVVNGEIERESPSRGNFGRGTEPLFVLFSFLSMLVTGFVLFIFFARPIQATADIIRTRPLRTLAVGALVMVAFVPAITILFISFVGIPLALIVLGLFIAAAYFSTLFVALTVGRLVIGLVRADKVTIPNPYLSLFLGLLIIFILFQVPYLGFLVRLLVMLLGIGAFVYGVGRLRNLTA
jgi:cytoskeletal protein CcmA (bactofilin family)